MTNTTHTPAPGLALNVPASFPGAVKSLAHRLAQLAEKCRPGYCVSKGVRDQIEECHAVASAAVFAIENQPPAAQAVAGWVAASERLPAVGERVWIAARAWNNPDGARIYGVAIYDGKAWGNPQDPEQSATWWPPTHWMALSEPPSPAPDSQLSAA